MMIMVRTVPNRTRIRIRAWLFVSFARTSRPVSVVARTIVLISVRFSRPMLIADNCARGSTTAHEVLGDKPEQK